MITKALIFEMHIFGAFCHWNNIAQCLLEVDLEAFTGFNWKYKITFLSWTILVVDIRLFHKLFYWRSWCGSVG